MKSILSQTFRSSREIKIENDDLDNELYKSGVDKLKDLEEGIFIFRRCEKTCGLILPVNVT